MLVQELKNKCNSLYSKAIAEMEKNGDVKLVRSFLLDSASLLLEIGKVDLKLKNICELKAKKLLDVTKNISSKDNYNNAFYLLTGLKLKSFESIKNGEKEIKQNTDEIICNDNNFEDGYTFNWNKSPLISFDEVAGLNEVKEVVRAKVLLPLQKPELFDGYIKKNGGGILLYGPPGTGKTMIAAAIAKEINAKFCSIGPSDLLTNGIGNSEKLISKLFSEARSFKCSVIFFDEFESLCPMTTHAQHAKQIRSELLKQMQGLDSYGNNSENILLLIGATNKPWDVDPAFIRPGRLGTRIYVDLPDDEAREYMLKRAIIKIKNSNKVMINEIDYNFVVEKTRGYNGADMTYLIDKVQEISIKRALQTGEKTICHSDFIEALNLYTSSVQNEDIEKLKNWEQKNG